MKKYSPSFWLVAISLQLPAIGILRAQTTAPKVYSTRFPNAVQDTSGNFQRELSNATEDISKRTMFSSTWKTQTGKVIIRYSSIPINYPDAHGNMQPFDMKTMSTSLVTGPTSSWTGGSTPSCLYPNFYTDSILVTVPAGINITYFTIDYAYVSNTSGRGVPINDGLFYFSTSCRNNPNDTISCADTPGNGDTAGICYLVPYADFHNPFTNCIAPSCNPQSFWLVAHLSRRYIGVGCDTNSIWYSAYRYSGFQYYFSAYVEGTPIVMLSKIVTAPAGPCNGTAKVIASGGTPPYTYLWSPNNQTTDSIGNQCMGTYCCSVTDNKGCTDSICVLISNASGINTISNSSAIKIFPDPNKGSFIVTGLMPEQYIELYDFTGHIFKTSIAGKTTMYLDISDKANGVYFIRILNKDGSLATQKKIVKMQ